MRDYDYGNILNQKTNSYFTTREYEYSTNDTIFRDYNIKEVVLWNKGEQNG